jgi:outer membrane protein assembly factor BamB
MGSCEYTLEMGKKLEKVKHINGKLALAIITVLLISSSLVLLNVNTATAQTTAPTASEMLADDKYGWPVGPGYDGGNSWFNPYSPAPSRPDVLWSSRMPDTGGSLSSTPAVAFDGKIFIHGGGGFFGGGAATLYALDPLTGEMIWSQAMTYGGPSGFGTSTMFKVSDGYLGYETGNSIVIHQTSNGDIVGVVVADPNLMGSFGGGSVVYWRGFYNYFDKIKMTTALANNTGWPDLDTPVHLAVGFDLSDPEDPKLAWATPMPTGVEALCGAPGLCIFGGYGEGQVFALNSTTGEIVWSQWKKGNAGYTAMYSNGKIYQSASSCSITCYDAETGDIIFDQFEGGRAFFVFGDAIAYNRYIGKNIALPYGYVGAWDASTGEPLWKDLALYSIAYLVPCVADGKFYCQRFSGSAGGTTAERNSFACWDVYTGAMLWEIQGISVTAPMVAYGNLYILSGGTLYCVGEKNDPYPMFHGGDDVENPGVRVGQSGPNNLDNPTWTYDSGADITGSTVAADGRIYFGTLGAEVHCLNAFTGQMIWKFPLGYRMSSTPAVIGDKVYIGPDDGNIYCLNAETGEEIWKTPAGGKTEAFWISAWQPRSSPIVVNGRLYVGSLDGNLYCVNAANGNVVWKKEVGGVSRPPGGTPLVVPEIDSVFISASDSYLYAFDLDGNPLWAERVQPTSGFDDRAMISTPSWDADDNTLWMCCDTFVLARFNATTGQRLNHIALPYSDGGTMTPAITTPAIRRVGSNKYIIVGDGFQIDCFKIDNIRLSPNLTVTVDNAHGAAFFGSCYVDASTIWGTSVNSTYANNVNLNITAATNQNPARGNETHLPLLWDRWLGHQVYSSPVVGDEAGDDNDLIYFGDDVFSITCVNATSGAPVSVYTTRGQVFGTACLYNGWMYMGSEDGFMYAFTDYATVDFSITSAANKAEMWNNETLTIQGRLYPTVHIVENGSRSYAANAVPDLPVKLSVTLPDGTDSSQETTCDADGYFTFNYNPTQVGDYGWVAYFEGYVQPRLAYLGVNGEFNPLTVNSPTSGGEQPPPPPPSEGIPVEYIYIAVAVIVIVIVALVVYFLFGRKK